jgi:hypothetical protein
LHDGVDHDLGSTNAVSTAMSTPDDVQVRSHSASGMHRAKASKWSMPTGPANRRRPGSVPASRADNSVGPKEEQEKKMTIPCPTGGRQRRPGATAGLSTGSAMAAPARIPPAINQLRLAASAAPTPLLAPTVGWAPVWMAYQ